MLLDASLLAAPWPWTFGEFVLALVAGAGAVACRRALRVHALSGDARASWIGATLRGREALRALTRRAALVAAVVVAVGLLRSSNSAERAGVYTFLIGVAVALAGYEVAAALERATRERLPVAGRVSAVAASEAATFGARSALLLVAGLTVGAGALAGVLFEGARGAWGFAAGTLLVAWLAPATGAAAPAAVRLVGMLSVQVFALAAATSLASPELAALARLVVACGAVVPWIVRTHTAEGLEIDAGRRIALPFLALLLVAIVSVQFLPNGAPIAQGTNGLKVLVVGLALPVFVARASAWRARSLQPTVALTIAQLLPLLGLAAVLVYSSAQGGAAGVALATAAAAALLPIVTLDGFRVDVAARSANRDGLGDGVRDASSAIVVLAGWAALRAAPVAATALDLRDPATAGAVTVGVLVALLAAVAWRSGEGGGDSDSTGARSRAMIAPAVLAGAVPWCVARLDAAAAAGISAGVLLGGGTAAFLAPLTAAAPLERIVQLTGVVLAFCSK